MDFKAHPSLQAVVCSWLSRHLDRGRDTEAFTLIELLMVVVLMAILASIALPTLRPNHGRAQDAETVSLLRNALTVVESANADRGDYQSITAEELTLLEPGIKWNLGRVDLVDPTGPAVLPTVQALAREDAIDFFAQSPTKFDIAAVSASGTLFGIQVQTARFAATSYVKVKVVEGTSILGW